MDSLTTVLTVLASAYLTMVKGCDRYLFHDCQDLKGAGFIESGVYHVIPMGTYSGVDVFCDMETDGDGWLIFQRRQDGSVDFFNNWDLYQSGFGNSSGEYWLGNLHLYTVLRQAHYELRIDLEGFDGKTSFAKYKYFRIGGPDDLYRLTLGGYSGTAGNNLRAVNGRRFTTKDRDNDAFIGNCAEEFKGGWWYESCHNANPNGLYLSSSAPSGGEGVSWWSRKGFFYQLRKIEMKIRRR